METFLITKNEYSNLLNKLDTVINQLNESNRKHILSETWLDVSEVCLQLKISKRTLQAYRDNGTIPYSKIGGKIYFKASDIEKHLLKHYHPVNKHF